MQSDLFDEFTHFFDSSTDDMESDGAVKDQKEDEVSKIDDTEEEQSFYDMIISNLWGSKDSKKAKE